MPAPRRTHAAPPRRPPATAMAEFDDSVLDADFYTGDEDAIARVADWLENKVAKRPEADADLELELKHLGGGAGASTLQTFLFAPNEDIPTVAEAIVDRAVDEGKTIGHGRMKFTVEVVGRSWGRQAFSLTFPDLEGDELDERPDTSGIAHQQMRHTENIMRQHSGMVEFVVRQLRADNESLRGRVRELEAAERANIKMLAELHDTRLIREIEMRKVDRAEARKDEVAGFLVQGVPLVMNKLLGGSYVGLAATPLEQMLHGTLSSMTQEQFAKMSKTGVLELRQDQVMMMLELYKGMQEKIEAMQRKATMIDHDTSADPAHNAAASAPQQTPETSATPGRAES